jgi:replicative DNA helicase
MVAVGRVERLDIYIDDAPSQTIGAIQSKSRRFVRDKGVGLIVLDYLQLARGPEQGRNGTREQEVSALSRGLKLLAKECGVPVVALSQLSRVSERRNDKRPTLSDLRESGAIEQDADNVLMLHRPEYYGVVQDEAGESLEGVCDVIVGKQRNGPVGEVRLAFDSRRGLFTAPQPSGHAFHGHNPIAPF